MTVINRIGGFADEMKAWRHWLHRNPELGYDLPKTAAFVAERLREFGVDALHEGIADTGMVAIIEGRAPGPTIGLRADMDALPIDEATGVPHASETPGQMHACGHDGHTTMLLGAAKYLAETRNFAGRVALIFQPAEEGGGGALKMVAEGLMERFDIAQVFAIHNWPGMEVGTFGSRPGPFLAAADQFEISVKGQGGHAAYPHLARDPIRVAVAIVQEINTIAARDKPPLEMLALSVTQIHAGSAHNIIPPTATLGGTVRTYNDALRDTVERKLGAIAAGQAAIHDVDVTLIYTRMFGATRNDPEKLALAASAAEDVAGPHRVDIDAPPRTGSEDFSAMLDARPGAYFFLGQGESAPLHDPAYDFNDDAAPYGASFFARLVERAQPL
ncbi:MAG: M20 aminoacylase family protein [Pseudomonadota bacterium]